jgi:hypothetical protein
MLATGIDRRLRAGRRLRLVTLPMPDADAADLWAAFRLLVRELRRELPELEYCGTRSVGPKTGVMHVHVVMDWGTAWMPQERLSALWERYTGYRVVDIREVRSTAVAGYVARQVGGYIGDQGTGRLLRSAGW